MDLIHVLETAVLAGPAHLPEATRRAAATLGPLPEPLGGYVDQVAHRAYAVTAADLDALRAAGQSEDQIFELTVSTALGAGMRRFRAGMAALSGQGAS